MLLSEHLFFIDRRLYLNLSIGSLWFKKRFNNVKENCLSRIDAMNVGLEDQIKYLQQSKSIINLQCGQTQSQNPKFNNRVDRPFFEMEIGAFETF